MTLTLDTKVFQLTRVGKSTAAWLQKLGIQTVKDLIFYYPFRWEDLSQITPISEITPQNHYTILGKIKLVNSYRSRFKKVSLTQAIIEDDKSSMHVVWFNQPYLVKTLSPGDTVYLSGKVDMEGKMVNPIYEKMNQSVPLHTARIVPIYSLTSKLTQKQLRFLIKLSLVAVDEIKDYIPPEIRKSYQLCSLQFALRQIHFPANDKYLAQALARLRFDELFLFQLKLQLEKISLLSKKAPVISFFKKETVGFVSSLSFSLTNSQRKAAWRIVSGMKQSRPMNILLEGDVGSGKTAVALIALLNCALSGYQAVLMVPTEILAKQHYDNVYGKLQTFGFDICLLTRFGCLVNGNKISKKDLLSILKQGKPAIVAATHSVIQKGVELSNSGLVIIDEQHRFGVSQRNIFRQSSTIKSAIPHILSMSATPIPRSLALTLYGDVDLVILDELPKNRKKIITKVVDENNRKLAYNFIKKQIAVGRQVFVVCPLIDPSDKLGVVSATAEHKRLSNEIFNDLRVGLLHGKLKSAEKEKVMADFLAGDYHVLVATSVIEVGVDVPNANVMVIEGAERFGLAQLHQLRGRVGRADHQSYCLLFTQNKNSQVTDRLGSFIKAKNGFEVAELDLSLRGPGEIYGISQSGWNGFRLAQLNDIDLIKKTRQAAQQIIPKCVNSTVYPELYKKLHNQEVTVHLG